MGRKHRGGAKKKAAATRNCPDCADPRYWCVAHLLEDGGLDCDEVDPSAGAPGSTPIIGSRKAPSRRPSSPTRSVQPSSLPTRKPNPWVP